MINRWLAQCDKQKESMNSSAIARKFPTGVFALDSPSANLLYFSGTALQLPASWFALDSQSSNVLYLSASARQFPAGWSALDSTSAVSEYMIRLCSVLLLYFDCIPRIVSIV